MAGVVETVGPVGASILPPEEVRSLGTRCVLELAPKAVVGVVATEGVTEPELGCVGVGGPAKSMVWRSRTRKSDVDEA